MLPLILFSVVASAQQEQAFYYLKVTSNDVSVNVFINGFPVYDINSDGEVSNQVPVNLALIGKGNVVTVNATPLGDEGRVSGGVALYKGGDIVSTDDNKPGQLEFEFEVKEEVEKTFSFDNDIFDFKSTLAETPVLKDLSALREYGESFLRLMKSKNTKAVLEEMTPKIEDTAVAFSVETFFVHNSLEQMLESSIFKLPITQLKKNQINAVPYCGGRVWELTDADGKALIYVKQSDGTMSMQVFVASINGKLRVVR
jgi:hypothetical protein